VKEAGHRPAARLVLLGTLTLLGGGVGLAENVDPGNDGSQHAWAENVGWINTEPSGDGGPGMHVNDFDVTPELSSGSSGFGALGGLPSVASMRGNARGYRELPSAVGSRTASLLMTCWDWW
jgi:hypothetical protein